MSDSPVISRRALLKTASSSLLAGTLIDGRLASFARGAVTSASPAAKSERLIKGWEYYHGNIGGVWEAFRGKAASDNVAWDKVEAMPHCFNARDAVDPDQGYYQGPGWYRTTLSPKNPYPNGRTILHFEGAGQKSKVFVYLQQVGEHVGGYDEWGVDITESAAQAAKENKGKVPVAVFCDNSRDLEMIPSSLSDFNIYGGLYRYVNLVYVPAISLERVHIEPKVDATGKASAAIRMRLYNPAGLTDECEITIEVTSPQGKIVHTSTKKLAPWKGETQIVAFNLDKPDLWSPKNPQLFNCNVTLKSAQGETGAHERFGFRYVEWVEHGPFKLNGERLLLRGTHRHEDHAGLAAAMTEDLIRQEMQMMKDMGVNFIRLAHIQQSPIVLDLCDELGFLVWEEIPWCRGGIGGATYKEQARRMLRDMIDQHYNHPGVILWGLGNENDWPGDFPKFDEEGIKAFFTELNGIAHQVDPSRKTTIRRCEFAKGITDVYSPSIWAGWYRGLYTEYKKSTEEEMKTVKHFFHAEWGGDSHARRHSENPDAGLAKIAAGQGTDERGLDYLLTGGTSRASKDGDWSETYICNLFDWHLKEQDTMPYLTGAAQWIFKDFSTPLRPENPVPRMNQKGVVERDLTPKEGYYVFQSYWAEKPMVRLYGHTWPIRWGAAGEIKLVKVYSNCPSAELFLNGQSCGTKKRSSQDFPAAGLRWPVKFKEGENKLRVVAKKDGVEVTDEITFLYQTAKWDKPAKLDLRECARKGDVVTVEARLYDAKGVQCLDSRQRVRFGLAGDGLLLDNLGTSAGSREVELYNGRAMISLRINGGVSQVSVASKDVPTVFLKIA
jgi:beta-galactosidase